ncbi:hypothetical protein CR513_00445, partial [Mucuna pruriens]
MDIGMIEPSTAKSKSSIIWLCICKAIHIFDPRRTWNKPTYRNPTLPQAPTGRVRKGEKRNSLEGTKVPRRGMHPSKATEKREGIHCFLVSK